jgi:hypothetical protein
MLAAIRRSGLTALAIAAIMLAAANQAAAHHSTAMFDHSKTIELKGVMKQLNWVNPHVTLVFVAENTHETWIVETTSPGVLGRNGWTKRSLKPGDLVEVQLYPRKDGGLAGSLAQVKNLTTSETLRKSN